MSDGGDSHHKLAPYESRDGNREGIDPARPEVTIACGKHVRVAVLICKDVLARQYHQLLGDLGVHLLGVPAMSAGLGDFTSAAHALVARSQGAMVVANNPRVWEGVVAETALLSHPVSDHQKTDVTRALSAPDISYGVLGEGWLNAQSV